MTTAHGSDTLPVLAELWSLREDVQVELGPSDGPVRLYGPWGEVTIQQPPSSLRDALHRMRLGPILLKNVISWQKESPATREQVQLLRGLERLQPFIIRTLGFESGQLLLSVVPLTLRSRFQLAPLPLDAQVRLSTFAEMRTNGTDFILESPLALHRVLLHRAEAIWLIAALGRPTTVAACDGALPQLGPFAAHALAYLVAAGMVVLGEKADDSPSELDSGTPAFAEDVDPVLADWPQVDLMFHTCSTLGRHDNPFGITYPLGEDESAEPVVKPQQAEGIPLRRPRWEDLSASDPTLAVAMEGRRSMRRYRPEPVTAEELGILLYRTARVRSLITPPSALQPSWRSGPDQPSRPHPGEPGRVDPRLSDRPYPGGGTCYELELYATIGNCPGIPSGVFHYDPLGHRLEPVNSDRAAVDELLLSAREAAAMDIPPLLLITMTARFRRVSRKYKGMAYALVLMDVGVLIQSLYLVCTAMRLAPCALGSVRADAAARAFGTDWRIEPSVGQFIVGRCPDSRPERAGRLAAGQRRPLARSGQSSPPRASPVT